MRRRRRQLAAVLALAGLLVVLAHPLASAGGGIWGNVGPASPFGSAGLFGRYPLDHYALDQHFTAVSASLTGGVDVSGLLPMIAYFLATLTWLATSFLANLLITLFGFAFSLDLLNGSEATGGAGALAPVAAAIHSIYANVFGAPWLVLAIAAVGIWAMWKALVQRRYSETAGALALSLIYIVIALFFVAQPAKTIGTASGWTNQMSEAFLSVSDHGSPSGGAEAKNEDANQLFEALIYKPWNVLEFGGLEHCVVSGTGSEGSDPNSAPVRPLSSSPARDAELSRRLGSGEEVTADGKVCVNNANKYAAHFLHFGLGTDERNEEYDALNHGDSSKLPEADTEKAAYKLGVADKPATDAMEAGGQYERLLTAVLIFFGELGAFLLLGSLSIGVILAQVLQLLLLAFAPVALVAAAIPGRGHDFFKAWLEKLAGYLLRKAAYSLILAILLAVNGALLGATAQLGWLMSFSLQGLFFWVVFLQRRTLTDGLIGIATGPGTPGREGAVRVLALYAGARTAAGPLRGVRRAAGSVRRGPARVLGAPSTARQDAKGAAGASSSLRPVGSGDIVPVGGGISPASPRPTEAARELDPSEPRDARTEVRSVAATPALATRQRQTADKAEVVAELVPARKSEQAVSATDPEPKFAEEDGKQEQASRRPRVSRAPGPGGMPWVRKRGKGSSPGDTQAADRESRPQRSTVPPQGATSPKGTTAREGAAPVECKGATSSKPSRLSAELREERDRVRKAAGDAEPGRSESNAPSQSGAAASPPRRRWRKGADR